MAERSQAVEFLVAVFGERPPDGTRIALWRKQDKTSIYLDDPEQAARFEGEPDVYVTAGLVPEGLQARRRLKARECAGIPGVWLDADVNGGPDGKTGVCPDREAADRLVRVELEPTILVNSGYGLQPWWLFDDPLVFDGDAGREQAARITQGWETIHRNHARRYGYGLDSTHDLARLMRLPGTVNGKGSKPAPVEILDMDGPRYSLDVIGERALTVAPLGTNTIQVDPQAALPREKFDALMDNHDVFRKTFNHDRKDRVAAGWSLSEYDQSLVRMASNVGWTENELAALIAHHRASQGDTSGKGSRPDYLSMTIGKVREDLYREQQERLRVGAGDTMIEREEAGTLTDDGAYSGFNQFMGGGQADAPVFKELAQHSEDPDEARYMFVLDDGRSINVGEYANLREPRKLDRRIGPAIGWVMPHVKDSEQWRRVLGVLLKHRTVHPDPEPQILTWLRAYLHQRLGGSRDEAVEHGEPFEQDGMVHIKLPSFHRFINTALKERVKKADLPPLLEGRGFVRQNIHHQNGDGKRTTFSYWSAPMKELEDDR